MPRGRPVKCIYCGSTDTTSKGARKTKSMGIRKIRRCRSCGRRFTPKHQKDTSEQGPESVPSEPTVPAEAKSVQQAQTGIDAPVEADVAVPASPTIGPSAGSKAPNDEYPRFGL